jgi:hypothetical protein
MKSRGQGLIEFALILPVLLFIIMGIIDFGRILFIYGMASNSLRTALRNAELLGYGGGGPLYIDCDELEADIRQVLFVGIDPDSNAYFGYIDTDAYTGAVVECDSSPTVDNGDLLQISLETPVRLITPLVSGIAPVVTLQFAGQRTIVSQVPMNADFDFDRDGDFLLDDWEDDYFPTIWDQNATDDLEVPPDGCNNGTEQAWNTNPLDPNSHPPLEYC